MRGTGPRREGEAGDRMSVLTGHVAPIFAAPQWEAEVLRQLEESHLVATSEHSHFRVRFGAALGAFLRSQQQTEVCHFYGRFITDLESFCHQLERAVPGSILERHVGGTRGVTGLLRARSEHAGRLASRFRFYIWHDADVLLRSDSRLFGQIVDAIAGVAAEAEYVSEDSLLIHRGVFVGGSALERYAEDETGQFRAWYHDEFKEPFWEVVTGLDRPRFTSLLIDEILLDSGVSSGA